MIKLCRRLIPITAVKKIIFTGLLILTSSLNAAELTINKTIDKTVTPAESLLPMLGGLMGILALIFILAALLKRFSNLNLNSSNIKIIESQNIGAKERIVIVEIQNKQMVLGVTPHQINTLGELEQPITKTASNLSFEKMMNQFLKPQAANKNDINSSSDTNKSL